MTQGDVLKYPDPTHLALPMMLLTRPMVPLNHLLVGHMHSAGCQAEYMQ